MKMMHKKLAMPFLAFAVTAALAAGCGKGNENDSDISASVDIQINDGEVEENQEDRFILTPDNPPNEGILFADLEAEGRSGHLGHALVEYAQGEILAFYPNCSAEDEYWKGHSGHGWMEYKRSTDGGETWSEPFIEPNSKKLFEETDGTETMMCEKAICTNDGTIVLFYLTCDMVTRGHAWEPNLEPRYALSHDGGETFSETREVIKTKQKYKRISGRIYDADYRDGVIYVLLNTSGVTDLFVSEDNGENFQRRSTLPFRTVAGYANFYGTMEFMPNGDLIAYTYNESDEYNIPYAISHDSGLTWEEPSTAYFEKKIRNPQLAYFGDKWWMHGRSGSKGENNGHFVLYSSEDGVNWDSGQYLQMKTAGFGAYSNNLVVHCKDGSERLLIQASHAYYQNRTNVYHWWIDKY